MFFRVVRHCRARRSCVPSASLPTYQIFSSFSSDTCRSFQTYRLDFEAFLTRQSMTMAYRDIRMTSDFFENSNHSFCLFRKIQPTVLLGAALLIKNDSKYRRWGSKPFCNSRFRARAVSGTSATHGPERAEHRCRRDPRSDAHRACSTVPSYRASAARLCRHPEPLDRTSIWSIGCGTLFS